MAKTTKPTDSVPVDNVPENTPIVPANPAGVPAEFVPVQRPAETVAPKQGTILQHTVRLKSGVEKKINVRATMVKKSKSGIEE
ncbi:hypothetical protein SH661x_001947 [Planctomicrobium sp. SH661]|uniref:hypothetical protein n=1 Tax=Planctomicrobium sp. SH661 TaxID=3448124 RepID=UPI003F5B6692